MVIYTLGMLNNVERVQGTLEMAPDDNLRNLVDRCKDTLIMSSVFTVN